jgi:hypothetical protein
MPQAPLPIDYTDIGYEALRTSMLALARQSVPEWTDQSENDLGVLLIELMAFACDITLYYQTRIATNLLPATADEPDAIVQLLRFIGYELRPPTPATANLKLAFDASLPPPIRLFAPVQFTVSLPSGAQLIYETERDIFIQALTPPDAANLGYYFPVPVVQGETVKDETVANADGSPNQLYRLRQSPVIAGSVQVTVVEPAGESHWQEVASLMNSTPADRHFVVQRDAAGGASILFGDGINGMKPPASTSVTPVPIRATYKVGGGRTGNVAANSVFVPVASPLIQRATNPQAAAGGADQEDFNRARAFAPHLYRTQDRAVTVNDYVELALQVSGVGKARAVTTAWNDVTLYIAPSGEVADPSELLKRDVLAYLERMRMATTLLKILGPIPADIYLGAIIRAQPYFLQSDVRAVVEAAVAQYLAFEAVDFGQPIFLSKVYDIIQNLPQVTSLTVFKFSQTPDLPASIMQLPDVDPDGIIELNPFELPRPGYRDNPDTPPNPAGPYPSGLGPHPSIFTIIEGGVLG